jgi:hypothetical protein
MPICSDLAAEPSSAKIGAFSLQDKCETLSIAPGVSVNALTDLGACT